ncbi:MAG: hypothetical protein DA408_09025 [Bacteroidetes bacterium]|nr:MAG: hypothetical protein C7N36_20885 [Bacteroidota bacterium]PTM12857.1 MAG: hypothetical protein DA408_09025 [Bacteroidota bacterium]
MRNKLIWFGLLLSGALAAQPKAELSILLGGATYLGDLEVADRLPDLGLAKFSPGIQVGLPLGYTWQVRAGIQYASYAGSDANSTSAAFLARNFSFTGQLFEGQVNLRWEPFARRRFPVTGGYKNIISPYLFLGTGLTFHNHTTHYGNPGVDGFPDRIRRDMRAKASPALVLPFGGGIRVDLSKHVSLGLEVGARKLFTDHLDGVSFAGNASKDDWYLVGGLTLSYRWSKPDYDRDGFLDDVDRCPQQAGVDYTGGCPDADGDRIPDQEDQCPYQPGKPAALGCPDSDFDGVPDFRDDCPEIPGQASGRGCPDADGDGLVDDADLCPYCAGGSQLSGCPDADGDGVEDARDRCPNLPGLLEGEGCPYLDGDRDGVPDDTDECPTLAGPATLNGCPDTDGDGLPDSIDKCPELAGTLAAAGCPEVTEEVKGTLAFVAKAVQFETGSNRLKATSLVKLDTLVVILVDYPYLNLTIAGHTDSRGNDAANLRLSQARAKACYDYLLKQGVPAERMTHTGFGETRPPASNATEAGRRQNRRVAFELLVRQ